MARRQVDQLGTAAVQEGVETDEERIGPITPKRCEGCIDLTDSPGVEDLDLQPDGASRQFNVSQRGLGIRNIGRIDQHGHARGCGHQLAQELQPLRRQLGTEKIDSGQVAARPSEACDQDRA